MKTFYTLVLSVIAFVASAQNVTYEILKNQPYTPLSNATVLSPNYAWGYMEELVEDFGFTINSFGENTLNNVGISEFEVVLLSDDFKIEQTLTPLVNSEEFWILDRGFDEEKSLEENEGTPSQSTISYKVEKVGATGEDVLKVEWRNVKLNGSTSADSVNFQVWCYKDGTIEYHYGNSYLAESVFYDEFEISFFEQDEMGEIFYYSLSGDPDSPSLVKDPQFIEYVNALPENGTVYRFYRGATGIEESRNSSLDIAVYPNPTKEFLKFTSRENTLSDNLMNIYSPDGKKVFSEKINSNQSINITHLPNGIYFLELDVEDEKLRKKFVKE